MRISPGMLDSIAAGAAAISVVLALLTPSKTTGASKGWSTALLYACTAAFAIAVLLFAVGMTWRLIIFWKARRAREG